MNSYYRKFPAKLGKKKKIEQNIVPSAKISSRKIQFYPAKIYAFNVLNICFFVYALARVCVCGL